jgi:large subunit ribosomal protein L20
MRSKVKKVLQAAKGFYGRSKNCYRLAKPRVEKAMQYQYVSRKLRKREARREWIVQMNAAARQHGVRYSVFTQALEEANIRLNRKVLSEICRFEPITFQALVQSVCKNKENKYSPLKVSMDYGLISSSLGRSEVADLTPRPAAPRPGIALGHFYAQIRE